MPLFIIKTHLAHMGTLCKCICIMEFKSVEWAIVSINLQNAFELMILSTFIRICQIFYLTEISITNRKSVTVVSMTAFS